VLAKQVLSQLSYTPKAEAILILKHFLPFRNPIVRIFESGVNPCFETVFVVRLPATDNCFRTAIREVIGSVNTSAFFRTDPVLA
jgi:hypothetical protein